MSIQASTLTSPGTWNIETGATLDFASPLTTSSANVIINGPGNSQPYGALRLDSVNQMGNVTLNGAGITIGDNAAAGAAASQISGNMSGGFGFTKVAPRSIILSGANTYLGPTVFSAGTLQMGSAETPGVSGPLGKSAASNPGNIVMSGGTLQYSSANSNDYSGRFSTNASQAYNIDENGQNVTFATPLTSSGGSLTLADTAGGGSLTLSGSSTYSGTTTINSGTLNVSGSIAGTVITVNGSASVLELGNATALPAGAILTLPASPAAGMVNLNFSGTQNITILNFGAGNPMPSGTYGSTSNLNVQNQNAAFTGPGILNVQPPTYWDPGFSDASPGSGGNGNWDSSSTNWFIGSSDTEWASNNIATFAGTPGTVTLNASEIADGLTFLDGGYDITNTNGVSILTLGGTPIITLAGAEEIDCVLAGTAGLTESGSGTLTLDGSNTFTGATTIGSGCALVLNGTNAYAGATSIGSGGSLTIGNSGNLAGGAYPGSIANSGGAIIYNSSAPQTLSGIISGSGTLTQEGPGPLTLSGLSTFTGGITISSGALTISGFGDLGNNPTFNTGGYGGSIDDAGAFIYNSSAAQTLSGAISDTGTLTQEGSGTLTLTGNNSYAGSTTIGSGSTLTISGSGVLGGGIYAGDITNNGTFTYSSSSAQTLSGGISGTGAFKQTSGSLTLSGTNTYSGATTLSSSATLDISAAGSILGNLTLSAGASLEMDNANAMASSATLTLASAVPVNLNYAGALYLKALSIAGVQQGPGVYGASALEPSGANLNGSGNIIISGPPITISSPTIANNQLTISWNSVSNGNYNVYTTTNLDSPVTWTLVNSGPIPATGTNTTYTLPGSISGQGQLFVTVQQ